MHMCVYPLYNSVDIYLYIYICMYIYIYIAGSTAGNHLKVSESLKTKLALHSLFPGIPKHIYHHHNRYYCRRSSKPLLNLPQIKVGAAGRLLDIDITDRSSDKEQTGDKANGRENLSVLQPKQVHGQLMKSFKYLIIMS